MYVVYFNFSILFGFSFLNVFFFFSLNLDFWTMVKQKNMQFSLEVLELFRCLKLFFFDFPYFLFFFKKIFNSYSPPPSLLLLSTNLILRSGVKKDSKKFVKT